MKRLILVLCLVALLVSGCIILQQRETIDIENEAVALAESPPAVYAKNVNTPSGTLVAKNKEAAIDYSNTKDGYVMVKWSGTNAKLKVQIVGPTTTYTYNLNSNNKWETFSLSDGNGKYSVKVYKNIEGTKYATSLTQDFNLQLTDSFAPFLRSNQYVNYELAPNSVALAQQICATKTANLEKIKAIYNYVTSNFTYDNELAKTVQSGYLPNLDTVLAKKKGICFDYAALMTGMARSQGIPCKLVVGYAGTTYHAWISIWTEEYGWIDEAIFFDGKDWKRLDPTFASTGKNSQQIIKYIQTDSNYTAKYFY